MTTLDNTSNVPDPSQVPVRPTAMKYGAYAAGISIIIGLIFYVFDVVDYSEQGGTGNTIASFVSYAILIGGIIMAIKHHKENELGGYITMGRSVGMGTLTALVVAIISAVYVIIFFNFVDPGALELIKESAMDQAMEKGTSDEQMEQMEGMMSFFTSPIFMSIVVIFMFTIVGVVTSLITGAVLKKDPPPFA